MSIIRGKVHYPTLKKTKSYAEQNDRPGLNWEQLKAAIDKFEEDMAHEILTGEVLTMAKKKSKRPMGVKELTAHVENLWNAYGKSKSRLDGLDAAINDKVSKTVASLDAAKVHALQKRIERLEKVLTVVYRTMRIALILGPIAFIITLLVL